MKAPRAISRGASPARTSTSTAPPGTPTGKYLYYLAAREFAPQFDNFEFNYATDRNMAIFAVALRKDVQNLFPVGERRGHAPDGEGKEDGEKDAKDPKDSKDGKDEKDSKAGKPKGYTKIDWEGLAGRVMRVPVPADNYDGLAAAKDGNLLYVRFPAQFLGRDSVKPPSLHVYSLKDRKETTLAEDTNGYTMSADGAKVHRLRAGPVQRWRRLAGRQGRQEDHPDLRPGGDPQPARGVGGDLRRVWRRYRDFFYVENMHGYDWDGAARAVPAARPRTSATAPTSTTSSAR